MTRKQKLRIVLKDVSAALAGLPLPDALLVARSIAGYAIYHLEPTSERMTFFKQFVETLAHDLDFVIETEEGEQAVH